MSFNDTNLIKFAYLTRYSVLSKCAFFPSFLPKPIHNDDMRSISELPQGYERQKMWWIATPLPSFRLFFFKDTYTVARESSHLYTTVYQ